MQTIPWLWIVATVAVLAGLILLVHRLDRFRVVFTISIVDGTARVTRGQPPDAFVIDVQRIADFSGIRQGTINGVRGYGGKVTLQFRGIARGQQWQFKNAWRNPI